MKITKESDYGIRAVIFLAASPPEKRIILEDLSKRLFVPKSFLSKILQKLVAGGIIISRKGNTGGFYLARPPGDITCYEIIELLEGSLNIMDCLGDPNICRLYNSCTMTDVWEEIQKGFENILKNRTIASLKKNDMLKG